MLPILILKNDVLLSFLLHRLTPLNMPDYAEVAGCSTFKNPTSPLYDSCGAYATTNLVKNANIFTNNFHNNNKSSIYSAPTSCHYNMDNNAQQQQPQQQQHAFSYSESNFPLHNNKMSVVASAASATTQSSTKMNIIENKMDAINNLNRSSSSASVPMLQQQQQYYHLLQQQQYFSSGNSNGGGGGSVNGCNVGTMKRNHRLPKIGHSDKLSFGGCDTGSTLEQPLYVKSKEDGSWTTVQNSTYQYQINPNSDTNNHLINSKSNNIGASAGSNGNYVNTNNSSSQIYLSSFGKTENV